MVAASWALVAPPAAAAPLSSGQIAVAAGGTGVGLGTGIPQQPFGLAVASNGGGIYVSDFSQVTGDNVIRLLDPTSGQEQTVAGDGALNAPFNSSVDALHGALSRPSGLAIDPTNGSLAIDELQAGRTVRYTPPSGPGAGTLSNVPSVQGNASDGDSIAVDSRGNFITPRFGGTSVSVWAAQTGTFWGTPMTAGNTYVVQETHATPWAVAADHNDNVVVSNIYGIEVLADKTGTYYGQAMTAGVTYPLTLPFGTGYGGDGGPASNALVDSPHGIYVDATGNLILADTFNNVVRVIAESTGTFYGTPMTAGYIYTVAGTCCGVPSFGGDSGPALAANLNNPTDAIADQAGNLVIADEGNNRVRVVAETTGTFYGQAMTAGDIYTVAGNGSNVPYSGDGGPAASAQLWQPQDVSIDASGNEVIADTGTGRIRVVAGSTGTFYGQPMTAGNVYTVAQVGAASVRSDSNGNLVVTAGNTVQVVAEASGTFYGVPMTTGGTYTIAGTGTAGYGGDGASATSAELSHPQSAILDSAGNVVVADTNNHRVRVVAESGGTFYGQSMTAGDIYTIAGTGTAGFNGDATVATSAQLNSPLGLALDPAGNVVVADSNNHLVRVIGASDGTDFGATVVSGGIVSVMGGGLQSGQGIPPQQVALSPNRITFDGSGDLIVSADGVDRVWVLSAVTGTLWGQAMTPGNAYWVAGSLGGCWSLGDSGAATSAYLCSPAGVAVDAAGTLLVVAPGINRVFGVGNVLEVTTTSLPAGTVGTAYSAPALAAVGGPEPFTWAQTAGSLPPGVVLGGDGTFSGTPTAAGTYSFTVQVTDSDSPSHSATGDLSITVEPPYATSVINTSAGDGGAGPVSDASCGTCTDIGFPYLGLTTDAHGNTVFADFWNSEVDVVAATSGSFYGISMTAGDAYVIAGGGAASPPSGPATSAVFASLGGLAVDSAGNLLVADANYDQIYVVAESDGSDFGEPMTAGDVYPVGGTFQAPGYSANGTPAASAQFNCPAGLAVDRSGNVLVADPCNNVVQVVAAATGTFYGMSMTAGDLYTIAGTPSPTGGYGGDGQPATAALLNMPQSVAVDGAGNVAIADSNNNAIRIVADSSGTFYGMSMSAGDIYTIAGTGSVTGGFNGDGISATSAQLNDPVSVAYDRFGNLYIADSSNNRVRIVPRSAGTFYGNPMVAGDIYTVAGTGTAGYTGDGGPSGLAQLFDPTAVSIGPDGTLIIADTLNNRIRDVGGGLPVTPPPSAAPVGVAAAPGNAQVTVSWSALPDATSYAVYSSTAPGGENTSGAPGCTTAGTSCVVPGLTNGTKYYFVVVGSNAGGPGPTSAEVSATPTGTVPVIGNPPTLPAPVQCASGPRKPGQPAGAKCESLLADPGVPAGASVSAGQTLTILYSDDSPIGTGAAAPTALLSDGRYLTVATSTTSKQPLTYVDTNGGSTSPKNQVRMTFSLPSGLDSAVYTVQVTVHDGDGDVDQWNWPISVGTSGARPAEPVVTNGPVPVSGASTSSTTAAFQFSDATSGVTYLCSLDGAVYVLCPTGSPTYSGLGRGTHALTVVAEGSSGTLSVPSSTFVWTISSPPPHH